MIFGLTTDERLRRQSGADHSWFAWYPVDLEDGRWAWLERVNRFRFMGWRYTPIVKS